MKNEYTNQNIIGCDETGVGDYLTPLIACAVFITHENAKKLEQIGVTDSKKISNNRIQSLAKEIKKVVKWQIEYLDQLSYNELNKKLNANELKMLLHMKAINKLEDNKLKNKIDLIIIDQFANKESINKYINSLLKNNNFKLQKIKNECLFVTNGETEHVSVAAASILARDKFLELMIKQNKKWNEIFPLGTNSRVEEFATNFVQKNNLNDLKKVAKMKFKTTKKLFGDQID